MVLLQPGEGKVLGALRAASQYLQRGGDREDRAKLCAQVQSRTREQTQTETRKALTGQKGKLFTLRTVEQWEGMPERLCSLCP